MPKRSKKLLVYLDQNFISDIAKADVNKKVKPEWTELYDLLKEGFLDEKLVVPQSWFHTVETSLAPVLKKRIVQYQNYLGQVSLHNAEHVKTFQTARFLQRFLGQIDVEPFDLEIAFRDHPDQRVQQFNIVANLDLSRWEIGKGRVATAGELEAIRLDCVSKKIPYEDQLELELGAQRDAFLKNAILYAHLCKKPVQNLRAFVTAPVFRTIPVQNIPARLFSRILTKCETRKVKPSDVTDIEVLATYLPYVDVVGTDKFMAEQLTVLGIDKEHQVRVFSAGTRSLRAFCGFLRNYLMKTLPANRPTISVFVLPSESVKHNAFRLFKDLAAATRLFGSEGYAEIYGFDDGQMPSYLLRGNVEVPFYGLQEVHPIKFTAGQPIDTVLNVCQAHCKSDHFVVIDDYRLVKETFLVGAVMCAEAGLKITEGYRIYAKRG